MVHLHEDPIQEPADDLAQRAARLYPNNPYLQSEWVRAVGVVRQQRGWVLDRGSPSPDWCAH